MQTLTDERQGLPSASGMERLLNCQGSWQAEQGCDAEPGSSVTADGTAIAEALESGDTSDLDETQKPIAERLQAMRTEAGHAWMAKFGISEVREYREERLWIRGDGYKNIASAQVDYALISGDGAYALIIDEKTGYLPVTESDLNIQLRTQAVALVSEYPHIQHVRVAIAHKRHKEKFDATDYNSTDLTYAANQIRQGIWAANLPTPPRSAGSWCRYCKGNSGKNVCRTAVAWASVPVAYAGAPMLADGKPDKEAIAARVQELPPATLAMLHLRRPIADNILNAVETRLATLPEATLNEVGLKRVSGKVRRVIVDNVTAQELLADLLPGFLKFCNFSVGTAAKDLAKKEDLSEEAAKNLIYDRLKPVVARVPNKPSIVPL